MFCLSSLLFQIFFGFTCLFSHNLCIFFGLLFYRFGLIANILLYLFSFFFHVLLCFSRLLFHILFCLFSLLSNILFGLLCLMAHPAFLGLFGLFIHVALSLFDFLFDFICWTRKFVDCQCFPAFQVCILARKVWCVLFPTLNVVDFTGEMTHFLSHALEVSEVTG
jgi:hypothetical protein